MTRRISGSPEALPSVLWFDFPLQYFYSNFIMYGKLRAPVTNGSSRDMAVGQSRPFASTWFALNKKTFLRHDMVQVPISVGLFLPHFTDLPLIEVPVNLENVVQGGYGLNSIFGEHWYLNWRDIPGEYYTPSEEFAEKKRRELYSRAYSPMAKKYLLEKMEEDPQVQRELLSIYSGGNNPKSPQGFLFWLESYVEKNSDRLAPEVFKYMDEHDEFQDTVETEIHESYAPNEDPKKVSMYENLVRAHQIDLLKAYQNAEVSHPEVQHFILPLYHEGADGSYDRTSLYDFLPKGSSITDLIYGVAIRKEYTSMSLPTWLALVESEASIRVHLAVDPVDTYHLFKKQLIDLRNFCLNWDIDIITL